MGEFSDFIDVYTAGVASFGVAPFFIGEFMLYDYGERMLEIMKEKEMTEKQLSKKTKISAAIIYAFLWYNLPIEMVLFEKMLKALEVSVEYFFKSKDN